jgi:hypothetical protein
MGFASTETMKEGGLVVVSRPFNPADPRKMKRSNSMERPAYFSKIGQPAVPPLLDTQSSASRPHRIVSHQTDDGMQVRERSRPQ